MAKLDAVVESVDDLPEGVRDFYTESDDGTYRLDVAGVEFEDDVKGLKNALRSERRKRSAAEKQLAAIPEDFDPAEWEDIRALRDSQESGDGPSDPDPDPDPSRNDPPSESEIVKRVRQTVESRYQKKLDALEKENEELKSERQRHTVQTEIASALDTIGITDPTYRKAAAALLRERGVEAVFEDGEYRAVLTDDLGEVRELGNYITNEWAKTEEAERFLPANGATGGGSSNSTPGSGSRGAKSIRDMSKTEKSAYIRDHGYEAFRDQLAGKAG